MYKCNHVFIGMKCINVVQFTFICLSVAYTLWRLYYHAETCRSEATVISCIVNACSRQFNENFDSKCTLKIIIRVLNTYVNRSRWPRSIKLRSVWSLVGVAFRILPRHDCLSFFRVVCCQVMVSVTGRSLVHRSSAVYCVCVCVCVCARARAHVRVSHWV
jgi:hypothetical protein